MTGSGFEKKVADHIRAHRMLEKGSTVTVGVSGGADSVCLFFMLLKMREEYGLRLKVIHVMHGIRGAEAERDMEFTRDLCEDHGIPFRCVHENVPLYAKENGMSVEEAGRYLRYEIFEKEASDKIAVAHNLNDHTETVLFNLFRGGGLKGLSGISPVNGRIIRPLLCVTRQEIEDYLTEKGIVWCNDSTNSDIDYSRNRVRNIILKEALNINPRAVEHIAKSAEECRAVDEYMALEADRAFIKYAAKRDDKIELDISAKSELHPVILQRVVYKTLCEISGRKKDITSVHVRDAEGLFGSQSGKRVDLIYGITAGRVFDKVVFEKRKTLEKTPGNPIPLRELLEKKSICLADGRVIEASVIGAEKQFFSKDTYTNTLDYDKINSGAVVRTRKSGDRISIKNGHKKVKDLMIEKKIPVNKRDELLMLADGNEVYWIEGIRCGHGYEPESGAERILEISIKEA